MPQWVDDALQNQEVLMIYLYHVVFLQCSLIACFGYPPLSPWCTNRIEYSCNSTDLLRPKMWLDTLGQPSLLPALTDWPRGGGYCWDNFLHSTTFSFLCDCEKLVMVTYWISCSYLTDIATTPLKFECEVKILTGTFIRLKVCLSDK